MRKKDNFNFAAFLRNMVLGIDIVSAVSVDAIKYTNLFAETGGSERVFKEDVSENDGGSQSKSNIIVENTYTDETPDENTETEPVFTNTLSPQELAEQPETDIKYSDVKKEVNITEDDINQLRNFDYLKGKFYIVDSRTDLLESDIDVDSFLNMDFSIDNSSNGPKVLIFHTHSHEMYADSDPSKGLGEGIWGVGEELKNILENEYGISVLHDNGRYDVVDGKNQILGAYERMEPAIQKILDENPSIEVVIDMHRDGVNEDVRLVSEVNGKTCAQIMFFNGLCRLNQNGTLTELDYLPNTYLKDNLSFSFNLQLLANKLYPSFTRRIYVNAYRYSLHMKPKSLLIEVGAQTNTKQEALNAMEPLADIMSRLILPE